MQIWTRRNSRTIVLLLGCGFVFSMLITFSTRLGSALEQRMRVPDDADYSKFQHTSSYHARLPCLLCHRRESNSPKPEIPGATNHLPCAGCHAKQFADSSNAVCT